MKRPKPCFYCHDFALVAAGETQPEPCPVCGVLYPLPADPLPEFQAAVAEVASVLHRLDEPHPGDTVEPLRAALAAARRRLAAANDAVEEGA